MEQIRSEEGLRLFAPMDGLVDHKAETRRKEVVWASSVVINLNQANAFEGLH